MRPGEMGMLIPCDLRVATAADFERRLGCLADARTLALRPRLTTGLPLGHSFVCTLYRPASGRNKGLWTDVRLEGRGAGRGSGLGQVEPLAEAGLQGAQGLDLLGGLDPLGDHLELE